MPGGDQASRPLANDTAHQPQEKTMASTFKVVPFVASVGTLEGSQQAAAQLEQLIQTWAENGWEYVRLESVETFVAGNNGCFGFGATPGRMTSYSMVVFRK